MSSPPKPAFPKWRRLTAPEGALTGVTAGDTPELDAEPEPLVALVAEGLDPDATVPPHPQLQSPNVVVRMRNTTKSSPLRKTGADAVTLMADLSNLDACKTRSPTGKIVGGENIQGFACGTTLESRVNKVQVGSATAPALVQVPYGDFCPRADIMR